MYDDSAQEVDAQADAVLALAARGGLRVATIGTRGYLTGPLLPWQWDSHRRNVEQLVHHGVLGGQRHGEHARERPSAGIGAVDPLCRRHHAVDRIRAAGDLPPPGRQESSRANGSPTCSRPPSPCWCHGGTVPRTWRFAACRAATR